MRLDKGVCVCNASTPTARWQVETGESLEALSPASQACTLADMRIRASGRRVESEQEWWDWVMEEHNKEAQCWGMLSTLTGDGGWVTGLGLERCRHNTNWELLEVGGPLGYYFQGPHKKWRPPDTHVGGRWSRQVMTRAWAPSLHLWFAQHSLVHPGHVTLRRVTSISFKNQLRWGRICNQLSISIDLDNMPRKSSSSSCFHTKSFSKPQLPRASQL